jgi:hypothetical protein
LDLKAKGLPFRLDDDYDVPRWRGKESHAPSYLPCALDHGLEGGSSMKLLVLVVMIVTFVVGLVLGRAADRGRTGRGFRRENFQPSRFPLFIWSVISLGVFAILSTIYLLRLME